VVFHNDIVDDTQIYTMAHMKVSSWAKFRS